MRFTDHNADEAEKLARRAVKHAYQTEFVSDQALADLDLARILSALGRSDEAKAHAQAALDLHEAKGDRPGPAEAQALFDQIEAGA